MVAADSGRSHGNTHHILVVSNPVASSFLTCRETETKSSCLAYQSNAADMDALGLWSIFREY